MSDHEYLMRLADVINTANETSVREAVKTALEKADGDIYSAVCKCIDMGGLGKWDDGAQYARGIIRGLIKSLAEEAGRDH